MKTSLAIRVALPIILAGIFIITVFFAVPGAMAVGPAFFVIVIFICVFIFFYGLSTGQKIAFPVRDLLNKAVNLSRGDLKIRSYSEERDEIGELARIFNKIAEELEDSRSVQENGEKTLSIKVQAKTKELAETISALEDKVKNRTVELEKIFKENNDLKNEINNLKQKIDLK
jgi:methyl-accepting chemotaxis protein